MSRKLSIKEKKLQGMPRRSQENSAETLRFEREHGEF